MQKLLENEFFVWIFNINLDKIEIGIQIFSTHKKIFSLQKVTFRYVVFLEKI